MRLFCLKPIVRFQKTNWNIGKYSNFNKKLQFKLELEFSHAEINLFKEGPIGLTKAVASVFAVVNTVWLFQACFQLYAGSMPYLKFSLTVLYKHRIAHLLHTVSEILVLCCSRTIIYRVLSYLSRFPTTPFFATISARYKVTWT